MRNQIAQTNDRLAIKAARKMQQRCNLPLEDCIQLSRMGMLKAIPKFDPTKGVAFSSFIVPYCEGEVKHFLRDHKHLVKSPRRWQEKSDEARCIQLKMANHGNRLITLDEIATKGMGLPKDHWETIAHATQHKPCATLDDALQVAAPESMPLEEREEREAIQEAVLGALGKLPKLTQQCLIEKFWGDLPDIVIAKRHHMTPVQLQTLFTNALQELRTVPC
ncbi:MAG TPA: sigma-70 family RNA polymerase sigma factor [Trichocoleus sp.]